MDSSVGHHKYKPGLIFRPGFFFFKQSYLATSREDIREAHTILAYRFTDSVCSLHVFTPQSISNVLTRSGLLSFLSILVHFP